MLIATKDLVDSAYASLCAQPELPHAGHRACI